MSWLEALMMLCFGAAWPVSILRSWRSRSTGGKSVGFLFILIVGYLAGIANKLIYSPDPVLYLYILNLCMVSFDTILYFRNRAIERKQRPGA